MKKQAVILIALFFSFNLLPGTNASGNSDCASKCLPQPVKSGHRHASGASVRLMHLNCCSQNAALPCELGDHRTVSRPDCSFSTCRTKFPDSPSSAVILHPIIAGSFPASGNGLRSAANVGSKAPPLYLQNLCILC